MSVKGMKTAALFAAVVTALGALNARAQHLPAVGEYGAVLAYNVALDGDDACIGTTTGIAIVRIANPARIETLSTIDTLRDSRCVVVGRYAYVSSVDNGLVVVDVSSRTSPRIVGRHRGRAGYYHLQVSGRHAYAVVSTGGLDVIDINDPARPTLVGAVSWAGAAGRVSVRGQTAYVSRGVGGVRVVDVSQATAPTVVGEVAIEGRGGLIALVSGHLAIATERGVCLYDISAPRAPVLRKLLPGRLSDIYSDGDRTLFVHSSGVMTVLDLSSIDSPRVLGTIGEYFHDLTRRGDLVFGVMTGLKVYGLGAGSRGETDQDLIRAATDGNLARVREIVERDPSALSVRSPDGRTPLHWAARGVHMEVVRFLVERGADVKAVDASGVTPLHSTASRGHLEACRLLVAKGAPVDIATNDGSTPFYLAARRGARDVLEFLLAHGARKQDLERRDAYGRTPLCSAARDGGGDAAVVKTLIDLGADLNAADKDGWSPIELAAWRPYPAVVDVLLDAGANLTVNTPGGKRLLGFAAKGLERLFDRMVTLGADLNVLTDEGGTLLYSAAGGGSRRILETLVGRGFDVNVRDRFGWAPLHVAVEQGRRENITFLLEKGADLNSRNALGQTPFNLAVEREDAEMVELLKSLRADTSAPRFPEISGPYLGRPRPGLTREDFAPGVVSHRYRPHSTVAVSPSGDEIFWNPMIESKGGGYSYGYLVTTRLEGGRWTYPTKAAFSKREFRDDHPVFSADGKTLYFRSDRAAGASNTRSGPGVWSVTKVSGGWSDPVLRAELPMPMRPDGMFFGFSFDGAGNYYFNDGPDIVVCRRTGTAYAAPEKLGPEINFGALRGIPYVSPTGEFLIFLSDMKPFISFRKSGGGWGQAVSMEGRLGALNVSFTGPYLMVGGQTWVDRRAIEAFRPKDDAGIK